MLVGSLAAGRSGHTRKLEQERLARVQCGTVFHPRLPEVDLVEVGSTAGNLYQSSSSRGTGLIWTTSGSLPLRKQSSVSRICQEIRLPWGDDATRPVLERAVRPSKGL